MNKFSKSLTKKFWDIFILASPVINSEYTMKKINWIRHTRNFFFFHYIITHINHLSLSWYNETLAASDIFYLVPRWKRSFNARKVFAASHMLNNFSLKNLICAWFPSYITVSVEMIRDVRTSCIFFRWIMKMTPGKCLPWRMYPDIF